MASPKLPASRSLKRQRDSQKCECCRQKRRKCYPHNRNWSAGEKCEPCKLGGQDCGPDVRLPRNGRAGAGLPHISESAPLLPRIPKSDPHPTSPNAGADQEPFFTNRVPTGEGSSVAKVEPGLQSQEASPTRVAEIIAFPSSKQPSINRRLEDCDDAPKCFARLCELRIILEELRNLQSPSLPPSGGREAISIEYGLKYAVSQTVLAFKETLRKLIAIAENEDSTNKKLIYREAIEATEAVDDDHGEFLTVRNDISSQLISLYEEEENWGAVEWQLRKLNSFQRHGSTSAVTDASSKLAECSQKLAAKLGQVLDAINIAIENLLQLDLNTSFRPLLWTLWAGYDEVTRILCKKPAVLEARGMLRRNALMVAAAIGKAHLLDPAFRRNPSLLVDRDALHRHALFHAAHNSDYEAFMTLVRAGANFNDRDASGRSILRVAAASGSARIVEYLLIQGVSPNTDVLYNSSALHDAASRGRWTVCKLLLGKGASANDRLPVDGVPGCYMTPSEVAKHNNFPDIVSMIEEAASRLMNDSTHPMNDNTHPTNDVVHQEHGQAHEPHHVDETQLTHTTSATHPDVLSGMNNLAGQALGLRETMLTTPRDSANDRMSFKKWLVRSDIVEFLRLEYPPGGDLGKIMVIYSDERDACCMDCEGFLARFAQPDLVSAVLNILSLAISSADQE